MKPLPLHFLLLLALLPCLAADCDGKSDSPPQLPTTQMSIGGQSFTIEIANDPKEREIGLMKRDSMPEDHGMIFVFPDEQRRSFWMKNTRFDLDIVYLDSAGRIDSIKRMLAYDLKTVPSDGPVKYAIELNAGSAEKIGLQKGGNITIPAGARLADEERPETR